MIVETCDLIGLFKKCHFFKLMGEILSRFFVDVEEIPNTGYGMVATVLLFHV